MIIIHILMQSIKQGLDDNIPRLGAALAFYALLSLVPLLLFLLTMVGIIYGEGGARERIYELAVHYIGNQQADALQALLPSSGQGPKSGFTTTFISFVILMYGASNVFNEWHQTLNLIWKVPVKPGNFIKGFLYQRLFAALLVLAVAMIIIMSIIGSALLMAIGRFAVGLLPIIAKTIQLWGLSINLGILALFFAANYKIIPDEEIAWKDVWIGAGVTAFFFALGQFIIGFYLAHMNFVAGYGATGSLVALLIWIYYSAQISFFGAEFTHAYAHRYGSLKLKQS